MGCRPVPALATPHGLPPAASSSICRRCRPKGCEAIRSAPRAGPQALASPRRCSAPVESTIRLLEDLAIPAAPPRGPAPRLEAFLLDARLGHGIRLLTAVAGTLQRVKNDRSGRDGVHDEHRHQHPPALQRKRQNTGDHDAGRGEQDHHHAGSGHDSRVPGTHREKPPMAGTDSLTIGLLGDVMLGRKVAERLERDPDAEVWSPQVRDLCLACDALVVNLECCVSDRGAPTALIADKPFYFRSPPGGVEALRTIGASLASVANNHTLDFGADALADTLDHLQAAEVTAVGAGLDAESARRGAVVQAGSARLGVLAVSDHPAEFASGPASPGIAHADLSRGLPDWIETELGRLRSEA